MPYFFLLFFLSFPIWAGLDKIHIKNLDLDYFSPQGTGEVEKISVGVSLLSENKRYGVEVHRREDSFEMLSDQVELQWLNPLAFVHNLQKVQSKKFNLKLDKFEQEVSGESLKVTTEKNEDFAFNGFAFSCHGQSSERRISERLKEDCLQKMQVKINHMELPFQFLLDFFPPFPLALEEKEIPAHDFSLHVDQGRFYSYAKINYVIRAYLKIWGRASFENNGKTLVMKIDLVKYGVLPVTGLVMNELRRRVQHPNVTIDPPWIRIRLETHP